VPRPHPPPATVSRRRWRWLALGWAVVVAALLAIPGSELPSAPRWLVGADSAVHFALFAPLALLVRRACDARQRAALWPRPVLAAALLASGWGAATEILQIAVPGRHAEWSDLVADAAGVGSALLVDTLVALLRQRFADGGAGGGEDAPMGGVADQSADRRT
jgi:VanZ family protein